MFGYRKDGIKLKKIDPIIRLTSYIMKTRNDAQVEMAKEINCQNIDTFIQEEFEKGNKISYMHVVISSLVRMYGLRPKLNRFVMSGRIYSRKKIYISFTVKKRLNDDSDETTIKLGFNGDESIYDVKKLMDEEIAKATIIKEETNTDKLVRKLLNLPHIVLSPVVGFIKLMDRFGVMPKSVLEVSPFHTSLFITNLKSIGGDAVFHHLYNFGTTGIFVGMGKEKLEPIVNKNGELEVAKIMRLGLVIDERVCDGFYYIQSVKAGVKHMENPYLLTQKLEKVEKDPELPLTRQERKDNKKQLKTDKKVLKMEKKQTKKLKKENKVA